MKKALSLALLLGAAAAHLSAAQIVLLASKPSHPPGQHEHNADVQLLARWLNGVPGVHAVTYLNGDWPEPAVFESADEIFLFCDGAEGHLFFQGDHAATIGKAAKRGVGLMFYHYATEPPAKAGHQEMLDWAAGFFDLNYSVNPIFEAEFNSFPNHPITRGVKPFKIKDEWYYNIRFRDSLRGFTPILIATPPANTVKGDGIRSGNPDVRAKIGQPHFMAWAGERQDGGRSVSFTGGHYHSNLGDPNFRKIVLNSLLWAAKVEVPANGVEVSVKPEELTEFLDVKQPFRRPGGAPPGAPGAEPGPAGATPAPATPVPAAPAKPGNN